MLEEVFFREYNKEEVTKEIYVLPTEIEQLIKCLKCDLA